MTKYVELPAETVQLYMPFYLAVTHRHNSVATVSILIQQNSTYPD